MPESPVVAVEDLSDVVVVRILVEVLDEESLHTVQAAVRAAAAAHPGTPFVVDLARVGFMPSLSLAALIRMHTEFQGRRQRLILAGLQPAIREVFVLTRLDRLFELQQDVDAAARAVRVA